MNITRMVNIMNIVKITSIMKAMNIMKITSISIMIITEGRATLVNAYIAFERDDKVIA